MLLSEAFAVYAAEVISYRNQSSATAKTNARALQLFVQAVGDIEVCSLRFEQVVLYKRYLESSGLSQNTIRLYIINLRNVIHYLNQKGIECINYEIIGLPKSQAVTPKIITEKEVQLLINSTKILRNKVIISLLYSSGVRVSELCRLKRDDIREDKFTIYGKGGKYRLCFIDKRTQRLLEQYLATRTDDMPQLILSRGGRSMTPLKVQNIFKAVRRQSGIKTQVSPHTLRHAFATDLLKNGCHLYTLSRLMGHASTRSTEIYLHLQDPELEAAYKKFH
jgi:integrase/recombinase XerD